MITPGGLVTVHTTDLPVLKWQRGGPAFPNVQLVVISPPSGEFTFRLTGPLSGSYFGFEVFPGRLADAAGTAKAPAASEYWYADGALNVPDGTDLWSPTFTFANAHVDYALLAGGTGVRLVQGGWYAVTLYLNPA